MDDMQSDTRTRPVLLLTSMHVLLKSVMTCLHDEMSATESNFLMMGTSCTLLSLIWGGEILPQWMTEVVVAPKKMPDEKNLG
jgi:hypothetical protein